MATVYDFARPVSCCSGPGSRMSVWKQLALSLVVLVAAARGLGEVFFRGSDRFAGVPGGIEWAASLDGKAPRTTASVRQGNGERSGGGQRVSVVAEPVSSATINDRPAGDRHPAAPTPRSPSRPTRPAVSPISWFNPAPISTRARSSPSSTPTPRRSRSSAPRSPVTDAAAKVSRAHGSIAQIERRDRCPGHRCPIGVAQRRPGGT